MILSCLTNLNNIYLYISSQNYKSSYVDFLGICVFKTQVYIDRYHWQIIFLIFFFLKQGKSSAEGCWPKQSN
jgi:hypothetical protein